MIALAESIQRGVEMSKTLLCCAFLSLMATAAHAGAAHLNLAQPANAARMNTFGPTTIPIGYYQYCERYSDRCARPAGAPSIALTQENWNQIIQVNSAINALVAPVTDMEQFGVEELWDYPTSSGDCEDYALQKRKVLNENGMPLGALLLTVGRDAEGGGHAVLTVVTDQGDFILDNQTRNVVSWRDAEITFLKRQSQQDPNTWLSLTPG
jgi:predicted transglutaminase-like cysteine proteinase